MERKKRTRVVNIITIALILCGIVWIVSIFWHPFSKAYTENAQIRQDIVLINSRVQGFCKEVRFDEFQYVHKGDTLMIIEDAEYRLQLAQAEASYASACVAKGAMNTSIKTTKNNISVNDAGLAELKVRLDNAEKEYNRYKKLLASESVTKQQFENVETQYEALKAKYEMMQRQKQSTQLVATEQTQRLDQNQAAINVAEAQLDLARLNLSYTVILAPCDGYTTRKTINEGELIYPGQHLVGVVNNETSWVVANFRERQLKHIAEGGEVKIKVDALPGVKLHGVIQSISNATGDQYSLVPQDNSIGNFVKVEQYIPVKIALPADKNNADDLRRLKSGMNVSCTVK